MPVVLMQGNSVQVANFSQSGGEWLPTTSQKGIAISLTLKISAQKPNSAPKK
jgi:hypothetical protein